MRILCVLCRDPFSQRDGATYAVRQTLSRLARRGEVTLTGFGEGFECARLGGYPSAGSLGEATNDIVQFLMALARGRPFSLAKYGGAAAQVRYLELVGSGRFDVVWYEQVQATGVAYLSGELTRRPSNCLHILRSHNVESPIVANRSGVVARLARPLLRMEAARLAVCERALVRSLDRVLAITPEDALTYQDGLAQGEARVRYAPVPASIVHPVEGLPWPERRAILFVGVCAWGPNADAARWITRRLAPVLAEICPDLRIRLVGEGTERFRRYSPANVQCCGFVEDLEREMGSALCSIAPVRLGGGVNIKVLEALAHGLPVVGTHFSRRGVDSEAYLEAETPSEFCSRFLELRRPGRAADLSARALASTAKAGDLFEAELDEALGAAGRVEAVP